MLENDGRTHERRFPMDTLMLTDQQKVTFTSTVLMIYIYIYIYRERERESPCCQNVLIIMMMMMVVVVMMMMYHLYFTGYTLYHSRKETVNPRIV